MAPAEPFRLPAQYPFQAIAAKPSTVTPTQMIFFIEFPFSCFALPLPSRRTAGKSLCCLRRTEISFGARRMPMGYYPHRNSKHVSALVGHRPVDCGYGLPVRPLALDSGNRMERQPVLTSGLTPLD